MKAFNRIIFAVALMLISVVSFTSVNAVEVNTDDFRLSITVNDASLAENSSEGRFAFFGNKVYSGSYGNQLSGLAKELYDSLVSHYVENKETDAYVFEFEADLCAYYDLVNGELVPIEDSLNAAYCEMTYALQTGMDAFLYDHPEVYWLKLIGIETDKTELVPMGNNKYKLVFKSLIITPEEIYQGASVKVTQFENAVSAALSDITVADNRSGTLKNIHDYICNKAWYNLVDEQRVHTAEPFFIGDGGVVCEGYAKNLKILCDRLGIPCALVSGDAGGAHMWNYVQLDDSKWYLVDVTWDDQDSEIYDTYFLANANTVGFKGVTISEERTERNDFSGSGYFSFTYPVLSDSAYVLHTHKWEAEYTIDIEPTCAESGKKSIHCEFCSETKSVTEIPAINHANKTEHAQHDADCTNIGYTAGVYCPDCEKWLEGHEIIGAAHTDADIDNTCDVCGKPVAETIKTGSCGQNITYTLYEDGKLFISGTGNMTNYNPYREVYSPFWGDVNIKNVIVQDGITSIGDFAFGGETITDVSLPDTITYIGKYAFYACGMTGINLGNAVKSIGDYAFYECSKLAEIKIPDSVTSIGESAFAGCGITNIKIGKGVTSISDNTFAGCMYLTEITLPDSVKTIGVEAFENCRSLISIIIPDSVTDINDRAFLNCYSLEGITIPGSVKSIGVYAFCGAIKLKKITIPDSVTSLGDGVFEGCRSLESASIGSGLFIINHRMFYGCTELKSVTFSEGVKYIGQMAFFNCISLTDVTIPDGVAAVAMSTFENCVSLKSITIPDSVTEIGMHAFKGCTSLKKADIPDSVKSISEGAFRYCESLEAVTLPADLTSLEGNVFDGCKSLKSVKIPNKVTSIKMCAFSGCTSLESITLPEKLTSIGSLAFYGCSGITSFEIPDGVTRIEPSVFRDCKALQTITIPDGVEYIGDWAFESCTALKSVVLPAKLTEIGDNAFARCFALETLIIPDGVKSIGDSAFIFTYELKAIEFPVGVAQLGSQLFYGCEIPKRIHYRGSEAQWKTISIANENEELLGSQIHYLCALSTAVEEVNIARNPSCTTAGEKSIVCTCGYSRSETVGKLGHNFSVSYTVDIPATCTSSGSKSRHCTRNGCDAKTDITEIPMLSHREITVIGKSPTCTGTGLTAGKKCADCGKITLAQKTVAKKQHTYKTVITKATLTKNGKTESKCSACGYVSKAAVIYCPKTIKLSALEYTYNGKVKTPSVTVKDSKGKTLRKGTDYTVTYSKGRKSIGKYTVTVTFKGNYSGTKKLTFEIVPAKVTLSKVASASKSFTATWKTLSGVSGYEVQYSTSSKFTKKTTKIVTVKKGSSKKITVKKLKKGKKYYVKVRAYKTAGGKKLYGAWSTVRNVKVK